MHQKEAQSFYTDICIDKHGYSICLSEIKFKYFLKVRVILRHFSDRFNFLVIFKKTVHVHVLFKSELSLIKGLNLCTLTSM